MLQVATMAQKGCMKQIKPKSFRKKTWAFLLFVFQNSDTDIKQITLMN